MNILTLSLLVILVSIPTLHASQRECSCSSASLGTITSTSKYTRQQRLQITRTNIMDLTLRDLAHSKEEKKDEKQTSLRTGDLVAQLPCGHSFGHAYLERSMEGRAEGELPLCPTCHNKFKMDQVTYTRVVEEKEL